jgi:hypothetical protein
MLIPVTRLSRAAAHEAGHAVVALVLGVPFAVVRVPGRHGWAGSCGLLPPAGGWTAASAEAYILTALAGEWAEVAFFGHTAGSPPDREFAGRLAHWLRPDPAAAARLLEGLGGRAWRLLSHPAARRGVRALAVELSRRGLVSPRRARRVVAVAFAGGLP